MQVRVDATTCEGYGVCAGHAPDVFELDELGYASASDQDVPDDQVDAVRRAVMDCPVHAIFEQS